MNRRYPELETDQKDTQFRLMMLRCIDGALASAQRDACRLGCHEAAHLIACARQSMSDGLNQPLCESSTAA